MEAFNARNSGIFFCNGKSDILKHALVRNSNEQGRSVKIVNSIPRMPNERLQPKGGQKKPKEEDEEISFKVDARILRCQRRDW